jgi:uncharacterized protein (TIGR04255 family)
MESDQSMATPQDLPRPPITEALVDFRTSVSVPEGEFASFAETLKEKYPIRKELKRFEVKVDVQEGVPRTAGATSTFRGVRIENRDGTLLVQARPDGMTVNNLKTYVGGGVLLREAGEVWERFVAHFRPPTVTRLALRYINRFRVPLHSGESPNMYLLSPPAPPSSGPQDLVEALSRAVVRDPESETTAVIVQRLSPHEQDAMDVIIDSHVSRDGSFGTDFAILLPILKDLRKIKNDVFFSSIQDETLHLFGVKSHADRRD